jgi:hypothetical protein
MDRVRYTGEDDFDENLIIFGFGDRGVDDVD